MTTFTPMPISSAAKEVLGQLFLRGPTWDGNVVSKSGRGELLAAGLAFREGAFTSLTPDGVRTAVEWKEFQLPLTDWSQQWVRKAGGS